MDAGTKLSDCLNRGVQVVAPGVYDPLSALTVAASGFNGVYVGGFATAASLGQLEPLMTMSEQVNVAERIVRAVGDIPVIVDGHTGFGERVHIARTIREFENAGVAAVHLEDQPYPKRVSYHKGGDHFPCVAIGEMQRRIDAACSARRGGLVVVARTDARGASGGGVDEVIKRLAAYRDAGADVLMPQVHGRDEAEAVHAALPGSQLFWFAGEGPRFQEGAEIPLDDLKGMGYGIVALSITTVCRAMGAVASLCRELRENGVVDVSRIDDEYEAIVNVLGAPALYAMEEEGNAPA